MNTVNKRAKSARTNSKAKGEDILLSHTGADPAKTAEQRTKARSVKVAEPKATHEYKGRTQEERAKDQAKANGIAYCK